MGVSDLVWDFGGVEADVLLLGRWGGRGIKWGRVMSGRQKRAGLLDGVGSLVAGLERAIDCKTFNFDKQ